MQIRLLRKLERFSERLLDCCVKNRPVQFFLKSYYDLAAQCLIWSLKLMKFDGLSRVYLRHNRWILPVSDMDLVCVMESHGSKKEMVFLRKFWRLYRCLRTFFPMLCTLDEIRFIRTERLSGHPLSVPTGALTLFTPDEWICLYSKEVTSSRVPPSMMRAAESTRHWNMYGKLQWPLLAGQIITELKFRRLRGIILKILQHLRYLENEEMISIPLLEERLRRQENSMASDIYRKIKIIPSGETMRSAALSEALRQLLLLMDRVHAERFDLAYTLTPAPHSDDDQWLGKPLKKFIRTGKELFGDKFKIAALRPIGEHKARVFLMIDDSCDPQCFMDLIEFVNQHNQKLFESRIRLMIVTEKIAASQFFGLWSPYALEAHILMARESYNPYGILKIRKPSHEWVVWKIRNSASIFEEYYLPHLMSPLAKGAGMDFCKIYERFEIEMLFHYFYYLKDRESYENDLARTNGDSAEIMAIAASKYARELGIHEWHPYNYASAYPYVQKLIRLVDQMAVQELARVAAKNYEKNLSTHQ